MWTGLFLLAWCSNGGWVLMAFLPFLGSKSVYYFTPVQALTQATLQFEASTTAPLYPFAPSYARSKQRRECPCVAPRLQCTYSKATSPPSTPQNHREMIMSIRITRALPLCRRPISSSSSLALLGWSLDLRIQPHEMIIDGVLLPRLRSLLHPQTSTHSPKSVKNIPSKKNITQQARTGRVDVRAHPYMLSTTAPIPDIPPLRCCPTTPNMLFPPNISTVSKLLHIYFEH